MYCPCCGDFLGFEQECSRRHSSCKFCAEGQTNYCTECGRFTGSQEHKIRHDYETDVACLVKMVKE